TSIAVFFLLTARRWTHCKTSTWTCKMLTRVKGGTSANSEFCWDLRVAASQRCCDSSPDWTNQTQERFSLTTSLYMALAKTAAWSFKNTRHSPGLQWLITLRTA